MRINFEKKNTFLIETHYFKTKKKVNNKKKSICARSLTIAQSEKKT